MSNQKNQKAAYKRVWNEFSNHLRACGMSAGQQMEAMRIVGQVFKIMETARTVTMMEIKEQQDRDLKKEDK